MSEVRFHLLALLISLILVGCCWTPQLVLDEEGYWAIADVLSPLQPYDWELRWPPFDEEGAFLYAHPPGFLWWIWLLRQISDSAAVAKLISTIVWTTVLSLSGLATG